MHTINNEHKIYTLDELSPEARAVAFSNYSDELDYDNLSDDMHYYLNKLFTKYKIKDKGTTPRYSLSYSQGDGASFTGDIEWGAWRASVSPNHWGSMYCHWNSVGVDYMTSIKTDKEAPQATYDKLESIIHDIGKELERLGYDVIEEANSDEAIAEALRDCEFTADGERWYGYED